MTKIPIVSPLFEVQNWSPNAIVLDLTDNSKQEYLKVHSGCCVSVDFLTDQIKNLADPVRRGIFVFQIGRPAVVDPSITLYIVPSWSHF